MSILSHTKLLEELNELKNNTLFQKHVENIKCGRFRRNADNSDYTSRVEYTQKLRNYVYDPTKLNLIFSDVDLKTLFFRTFGYQGKLSFTIYPNAWLRDFPLLDIGENVYLGDGILLGTNQVSRDQRFITVGTIKIGENTIIDQRGAIGYNSILGKNCAIGFDVSIGLKCNMGDHTIIGERTSIGHGIKIGNSVKIGQRTFIGNMSIIEDEVNLAPGAVIPPFSQVSSSGIINYRTNKKVIA